MSKEIFNKNYRPSDLILDMLDRNFRLQVQVESLQSFVAVLLKDGLGWDDEKIESMARSIAKSHTEALRASHEMFTEDWRRQLKTELENIPGLSLPGW